MSVGWSIGICFGVTIVIWYDELLSCWFIVNSFYEVYYRVQWIRSALSKNTSFNDGSKSSLSSDVGLVQLQTVFKHLLISTLSLLILFSAITNHPEYIIKHHCISNTKKNIFSNTNTLINFFPRYISILLLVNYFWV